MCAVRIGFLILAHDDAPHLERLCRTLSGHPVFVHIDARATQFPVEAIAGLPAVRVVTPRYKVHWGDISMVKATLSLMRASLADPTIDRLILLSGSCYPVKPLRVLERAFEADRAHEWIAITPIQSATPLHTTIGRHWRMAPLIHHAALDVRLRRAFHRISRIAGRRLEREIGMVPHFGSQWWGLTRACAQSILDAVDAHPSLLRAYGSVYAPDEHVFQTIVANSAFADAAIHVPDRGLATNQLAPLHQIAPATDRCFGNSDADFRLAATTGKFFIRKVSTARSTPLLDRIDRELLRSNG